MSSVPFRLPASPLATDLVAKYFRGLGDPIRLRTESGLAGQPDEQWVREALERAAKEDGHANADRP